MTVIDLVFDIRIAISALLVTAGLLKMAGGKTGVDPLKVAQAAGIALIAPVRIFAKGLPFMELMLGVWLSAAVLTLWALLSAAALLTLFTVIMSRAFITGYSGGCACFGIASRHDRQLGLTDIFSNAVLIISVTFTIAIEFLAQTTRSILDATKVNILATAVMTGSAVGVFLVLREMETVSRTLRELRNG